LLPIVIEIADDDGGGVSGGEGVTGGLEGSVAVSEQDADALAAGDEGIAGETVGGDDIRDVVVDIGDHGHGCAGNLPIARGKRFASSVGRFADMLMWLAKL
jgi:hypothetical protein